MYKIVENLETQALEGRISPVIHFDQYVPKDFECLRSMVATYEDNCEKFDDYSRKFIRYLVRECENPSMSHSMAKTKLKNACLK